MRSFRLPVCLALASAAACSPTRTPAVAHDSAAVRMAAGPRFCSTPRDGLIISPTRVALFPTHATTAELHRLCGPGTDVLYDAVGWQAPGEAFAFHGARITAVLSDDANRRHPPDVPDLWTAEGDSLRLEDGRLVPRTLGELRKRYGRAIADDNANPDADDFDGFRATSCRFPYLSFKLDFEGRGIIPDSSRILSVEMWVPPPSGIERICHR